MNPAIFDGKLIICRRRMAVEYVLWMLAACDTPETILAGYPWFEPEDIQAYLAYARAKIMHHSSTDPISPHPIFLRLPRNGARTE
jgi:uncharacterized protein (DUF433 family)